MSEQKTLTATSAADLRLFKYHLVRWSAAQAVNVASLETASSLAGVLLNDPNTGEGATVCYEGLCTVMAGAAITAPAIITNDSSGRAVAAGSGDMACGRAMIDAAATGDLIEVLVFPPTRWAGAI